MCNCQTQRRLKKKDEVIWYLLGLQVTDDGVDVVEDLINEGHHLPHLHLHKMPPALLSDLNECVTRHVLHSIMGF